MKYTIFSGERWTGTKQNWRLFTEELLFEHAPHLECSLEDVPSVKHCSVFAGRLQAYIFFPFYISNKFF